jgi:hypothetical protein
MVTAHHSYRNGFNSAKDLLYKGPIGRAMNAAHKNQNTFHNFAKFKSIGRSRFRLASVFYRFYLCNS